MLERLKELCEVDAEHFARSPHDLWRCIPLDMSFECLDWNLAGWMLEQMWASKQPPTIEPGHGNTVWCYHEADYPPRTSYAETGKTGPEAILNAYIQWKRQAGRER